MINSDRAEIRFHFLDLLLPFIWFLLGFLRGTLAANPLLSAVVSIKDFLSAIPTRVRL